MVAAMVAVSEAWAKTNLPMHARRTTGRSMRSQCYRNSGDAAPEDVRLLAKAALGMSEMTPLSMHLEKPEERE